MISFLSPLALWSASLLAIPVLIHLFKPRKVRRTPFSSLRWLHLSQQKLSRRLRWHQVLLFILRAAFIALLALALAKPVFSRDGRGAKSVERFVVLDTSRSMGYRPPGAAPDARSPLDVGREVAAELVAGGMAGDRSAVLLAGSGPATGSDGGLSHESAVQAAALKGVRAGAGDADLGEALRVLRPMLAARRPNADVELNFVTDNLQSGWPQAGVSAFARELGIPARVRIVDVGTAGGQNAWVADARLVRSAKPNDAPAVRVRVGTTGGDAKASRLVRIAGIKGLPDVTRSVAIDPDRGGQVDVPLPGAFDLAGQVARVSIEPGDALPGDDEFFLSLEPPDPTRVLLVEPQTSKVDALRPGFHLGAALGALAAADGRAIDVVTEAPDDVAPADLDALDAVVLAGVGRVSEAVVAALESRVSAGAGLAVFLGPQVDAAFYNGPAVQRLLGTQLGGVAEAPPRQFEHLTDIRWSHPLVAGLQDPALGDLPQASFRRFYELTPPAGSDVVASVGGRAPAIVERALGAGRVVVFNTTANDAWGDLPRRKSFVPLVDRLLARLTGGGTGGRRSFDAGETVTLPLPGFPPGQPATVITPGGERLTPAVSAVGRRTVMRIDGLDTPGIYRVEGGAGQVAASQVFVVQAGRGDSTLTPVDPEALRKWWAPLAAEVVTPAAVTASARAGDGRVALWPPLVAIACLVLVAEMFLVHWLCPRMNPGIAAPVVGRRRMFRSESTPLTEGAVA